MPLSGEPPSNKHERHRRTQTHPRAPGTAVAATLQLCLEKILLPLCREGLALSQSPSKRAAVLIENRINHQWLFTVAKHWPCAHKAQN